MGNRVQRSETVEIYDKELGLEFNYVQGGNIANYSDDEVWQDLKVNYHIVKV
jgi:hypothetical protein